MPVNSFENYKMSWRPDRSKLSRPCYLSLANLLEEDIQNGHLAPGTRLPPQRELADFLDIHFTTVTRAYDLCREKHLIYGIAGKGTFTAPYTGHGNDFLNPSGKIQLGIVHVFDECNDFIPETA